MLRWILVCPIPTLLGLIVLFAIGASAIALPPLGLTELDISVVGGGQLSMIDGIMYMNTSSRSSRQGVAAIDADGAVTLVELVHPEFTSSELRTTRVIKSDGHLYVGAEFLGGLPGVYDPIGAALFRLSDPSSPVATWYQDPITGNRPSIAGFDSTLRGFGEILRLDPDFYRTPVQFFMNGTVVPFDQPRGGHPPDEEAIFGYVTHVTESGNAVGGALVPGGIGVKAAIWTPDGEFSFIASPPPDSVRDRSDGQGLNIGAGLRPGVKYGDQPLRGFSIRPEDEPSTFINTPVVVSQSDFAVMNVDFERAYAYYPGILPDQPEYALPLEDVFPELSTINFVGVSDLYAVDGRIYMTLYGEDKLYLFGARDPSVIPEPATVVLALLAVLAGCGYTARRRLVRRSP